MRLILIGPYQNPHIKGDYVLREIVENARKKGQLEGVEMDIDLGYPIEDPSVVRDEEFVANISVGFIKKVKEYSNTGKYDGIVSIGGFDPGFLGARVVSKIPVAASLHSAVHVASLIGERFGVVHTMGPACLLIRHCVVLYGLGSQLASARYCGHTSTELFGFVRQYKKEERIRVPEVKKAIESIVAQCLEAISKERVDSLVFACGALQPYEDEVRQALNEAGYDEIPTIWAGSACIEMAKAMVNMKLMQAPRAHPGKSLRALPEYW